MLWSTVLNAFDKSKKMQQMNIDHMINISKNIVMKIINSNK